MNEIKEFTKRLLVFLFLCFVFIAANSYAAKLPSITVVKDGHPNAVIVLPDSASMSLRNAAKVLQAYIQQSTGAFIPINDDVQGDNVSINVGLTSYAKRQKINLLSVDEDGFILRGIGAQHFIIVGGTDWGTEFGIYSFLERYLGVAWLIPSLIGIDIPSRSNLIVPDDNIIDNPIYISRQAEPVYIGTETDLGLWGRHNRLRGRIAFSHNLLNLFDPKEFYGTNRDFYPIETNQQILSTYKWQPNFSAPGIADSASAKIIRYFKHNPKVSSYSLGINDYTVFDQSTQSLARRNLKKNYLGLEDVSNDYFEWVNQVAKNVSKVYPDKKFGLLAYNNVAEPPTSTINSNVIPYLTYERLRWSNDSLENSGHQLTERWSKISSSIGWYDYTYGYDYLIPRVWFHEMQKYLIWGSKHNVKYYFAELYPNWGEGPKPWIQAKLLWNPEYNVDSLLNVWYVKTAGPKAALSLKKFYALWEGFWTKDIFSSSWNNNKGQYLRFDNFSYLDAVPKIYIQQSDVYLNTALQLAETDIQKQRVTKILDMWRLYKYSIELYQQTTGSSKVSAFPISQGFINLLIDLEKDPLFSLSIENIKKVLKIK